MPGKVGRDRALRGLAVSWIDYEAKPFRAIRRRELRLSLLYEPFDFRQAAPLGGHQFTIGLGDW
jgi:hypothetical protein